MSIDGLVFRLAVACLLCASAVAQQSGPYRSRILLDPLGELERGSEFSIDELEREIASISDPYARSSATRHLARHYVQQGDYAAAAAWYRDALAAGGLADVANRELMRELARVHMLAEDFPAAAEALEQALALDLVPVAGDLLLRAQVAYHQGDYLAVVTALDRIAAAGLVLDMAQRRQALALYYSAGAYAQCETLLEQLLTMDPAEAAYWHQLASVYLQQDKRQQALDQLVLARENRIPFTVADMTLLVDLLAVNGNPYGAALILEGAMAAGEMPGDAANQRKLFELWFQARERDRARQALSKAAAMSDDTELYLYLAQLHMEDQRWPQMQAVMLDACDDRLAEPHVSRANLLLGISLLKQNHRAAARRQFINATLVGGAHQQAVQWLKAMDAAEPDTKELLRVQGPCVGEHGRQVALRLEGSDEQGPEVAVEGAGAAATPSPALQVVTADSQRFFYAEQRGSLEEVVPVLRNLALRLSTSLVRAGGTRDGPLQVLSDGSGVHKIGFPVRGSVQASGRYRVLVDAPFTHTALALDTRGDMAVQVEGLLDTVRESGLTPSGRFRLVLRGFDSGDVELQVGVQGPPE